MEAFVYVTTSGLDDVKDKPINHGIKVIDASTNTVKKKIKVIRPALFHGQVYWGSPVSHDR